MRINNGLNLSSLGEFFSGASRLLSNKNKIKHIHPNPNTNDEDTKQDASLQARERVTYGLVSLEIMSDAQYQAFERITKNMSTSEKITIAQILTRAGNLSASVEKTQEIERATNEDIPDNKQNFLGITQEGWRKIAQEFQDNLNNLDGIYTKHYNKNITSNYNDILRKNNEAKIQRILREFSHAILSGNAHINTTG